MLKRKKRTYASIITKNNELGFTLLSTLLAITIIALTLPLLSPLVKSISYQTTYHLTSTEHFFFFIYQKKLRSKRFYSKNNKLYFENENNLVVIEQFGSVIRRRVNRQGHEIYLRDVDKFSTTQFDHYITVDVQLKSGETYEKTLINFK